MGKTGILHFDMDVYYNLFHRQKDEKINKIDPNIQ